MGEIVLIGQEHDEQRQIDRACAAQSPEMLPETKASSKELADAKSRIAAEKAQYESKHHRF